MILNKLIKQKNTISTTDSSENSSLMLRMVTSYSIFLLVILVLFYFLYHSTFNNMRNSYNQQNRATMMSNTKLFEKDLDIMDVYCRQLLQDDTFRKIMNYQYADAYFNARGNNVKISLATDVYPETLLPVEEVYCHLPQTGYILSPSHFITQERFYHWIKYYSESEYENWLKALTNPEQHNRFIPMDFVTPNSSKDRYMYMINLNDLYFLDAQAVVCFVVDKAELSELFGLLQNPGDNHFLTVQNAKGDSVLSIDNSGVAPSLEEIKALDFQDDFASLRLNGTAVTVGKFVSVGTGYTYYYSFPSFAATNNMAGHRIAFFLIFIIALLIGGTLVFIFSRRNVRPILELGQELHEAVEIQNHLQEVVESQRPIICTSYVRQLLSGTIVSEEEADYIKDYLGLGNEALAYNVLYIVVYNNFDPSQDSVSATLGNEENFNDLISETLERFFGHPLYMFSPADRTYAVLTTCNPQDADNLILKMQDIVLHLHDYMLDTYGIWLFAGIGKNADSLMNIWECYQQAVEAVSYTNKNYIFYPYEFIKKDSNVFYYPTEISTKLIHFISTGNTAQVLELFNLIHQENIEDRSLPINLVKFLLSDIRNSLLKARFALPVGTDPEQVALLDERFNEHLSFKLCEDLALTLCRLFTSESDENNLASTIEKYILNNYMDPSLGLNKISDEFQISESYFSHMFKEKTGVNFSNYLENIRMSEAARLIRETDISLNELFIAVGYNNPNSFRRAFKKVYGITPSSMREGK